MAARSLLRASRHLVSPCVDQWHPRVARGTASDALFLCCRSQRHDFARSFPHASASCIDLLNRMLQFDPRRRITVEQALQHPYLADMHDEASEMSAPGECPDDQ